MGILNPRSRLITFRVADWEYEALRSISLASGARSLSEFIRSTVCCLLDSDSQSPLTLNSFGVPAVLTQLRRPGSGLRQEENTDEAVRVLTGVVMALHRKTDALARVIKQSGLLPHHAAHPPAAESVRTHEPVST
jgi:hypothetical protein